MNLIGTNYRLTLIGSSHGNLVGVVIDGCPPGKTIDINKISLELQRRRPGQSAVTTQRGEEDKLIIESGILKGKTTGEPIVAFIRNEDIDSSYYEEIKDTPRPGHADYPAYVKYKGANDPRGGGRFSGRMTAGLVIAGSIAQQILSEFGIEFYAYAQQIYGIAGREENYRIDEEFVFSIDNPVRVADENIINEITTTILKLKEEGDSCGGVVETKITGMPVGVGEPWFDSIESRISHMMFSIPAVKGVEFGSGFESVRLKGSEHNDPYNIGDDGHITTLTNNAGGILGGLSNGMPIIFRVGFKPTSSILKTQQTIDKVTQEVTPLEVRGRHDPCIVPRAVPVVSNAAACVILDLFIAGGYFDSLDQNNKGE